MSYFIKVTDKSGYDWLINIDQIESIVASKNHPDYKTTITVGDDLIKTNHEMKFFEDIFSDRIINNGKRKFKGGMI